MRWFYGSCEGEWNRKGYPEGTTYLEIARDFQDQYENDILLVRVNGKLRELDKTLTEDSEISFITAKGNAGIRHMSAVRSF